MIRLSLALRSEQLYCGSHSGQSTTIWTALQILEHWASSVAADEGRESFLRSPCRTRTALSLSPGQREQGEREPPSLRLVAPSVLAWSDLVKPVFDLVRPGQTRI